MQIVKTGKIILPNPNSHLKSLKVLNVHIWATISVCRAVWAKLRVLVFAFILQTTTDICAIHAGFLAGTWQCWAIFFAAARQQRSYFFWTNIFKTLDRDVTTAAQLPTIGFRRELHIQPLLDLCIISRLNYLYHDYGNHSNRDSNELREEISFKY